MNRRSVICGSLAPLVVLAQSATAQVPVVLSPPDARPVVSGVLLEPVGGGTHAAVILLPGSGGWRPENLDVARALTEAGFVTLTLDYYVETGNAAVRSEDKLAKWPNWQATVQAAVALITARAGVDRRSVGLLGFSRGAFLAVSVAGSIPTVGAVVDLYGGGGGGTATVDEDVRNLPPLLILHGDADDVVPVRFATELRDACLVQGRTVEMHLYAGVGHGFTVSSFPTYSAGATNDAIARAIRFFRRSLRRP